MWEKQQTYKMAMEYTKLTHEEISKKSEVIPSGSQGGKYYAVTMSTVSNWIKNVIEEVNIINGTSSLQGRNISGNLLQSTRKGNEAVIKSVGRTIKTKTEEKKIPLEWNFKDEVLTA